MFGPVHCLCVVASSWERAACSLCCTVELVRLHSGLWMCLVDASLLLLTVICHVHGSFTHITCIEHPSRPVEPELAPVQTCKLHTTAFTPQQSSTCTLPEPDPEV